MKKIPKIENEEAKYRRDLDNAIKIVREEKKASCSLLQRKLKIGYALSARLLDQLEEMGVVAPLDPYHPSAPRKIL